jgi:pyruvate-formate lyase-activating enzyme
MVYIRLKDIMDENFQDYKKPSMMLATSLCDWKCLIEENLDISICQNSELYNQKNIEVSIESIIKRYFNNPITKAIVIGGLEPLLQFDEVLEFIKQFRLKCIDDVVIYTGYYPEEIQLHINELKKYKNIIMKYGRYKHNDEKTFDEVLGIWLISKNQFAKKIS